MNKFLSSLSKKQNKNLRRIILAMIIFAGIIVLEHIEKYALFLYCLALDGININIIQLAIYLVPYLIVGHDVIRKCFHGIAHGQMFDESFLMTLATIGAFATGEYKEAVAVMLFYQVGEFFQNYAVGQSRNAIQELMSIAPDYANVEQNDGSYDIVEPEEVKIGDVLVVKAGEKIPVDGIVLNGEGYINTSSLTGESMPQFVSKGDKVISGCINGENLIRITASKTFENSTVSQILELVENAANKKSKTESFITRFAKYYTPFVVISGALLAFIPPIFVGNLSMWILRACTFLVISCPCALVISVPLAFFGGIGAASKIGVLIKGSNYLEMMAKLDTIVTDKTGTLTEGKFQVTMIEAAKGYKADDVLKYAAAIENASTHPIAQSIIKANKKNIEIWSVSNLENIAGKGVKGDVGFATILAGNKELLQSNGIVIENNSYITSGTIIYVSKNNKYIGCIQVNDKIKENAKEAIEAIKSSGVNHIVMLTGDSEESAKTVADELSISKYISELLPQDKVKAVEKLLSSMDDNKVLAFIGDGVNDAPVLARADVGIAMGSLGSDAAIEAADIVIMDDNIEKIPALIRIANKTVKISKSNIAFALVVKVACLLLGALGIANMWVAVFADVGVAMICIFNSMRMLVKNKENNNG